MIKRSGIFIPILARTAKIPTGNRGFTLLEVLLGLAILTIVAVSYVGALSTSSIAVKNADRKVTAEIIARSQLEHTKSQAFENAPYAYPSITEMPSGYSVTSNASSIVGRDDNIQLITVDVQFDLETILSLEDFKTNR